MQIRSIHNQMCATIERALGEWFIPTLARFAFAAVLLCYFWSSAKTKIGDGFTGLLFPSDSAYIQIFPKTFAAVGYDSDAMGIFHWLVAVIGTMAEFVLPLLLIIGLFTRITALGMVGFVLMQSYVDVTGHGVARDDIGGWFDNASNSLLMDQRLLWMVLFAIMIVNGAGPFSMDKLLGRKQAEM